MEQSSHHRIGNARGGKKGVRKNGARMTGKREKLSETLIKKSQIIKKQKGEGERGGSLKL